MEKGHWQEFKFLLRKDRKGAGGEHLVHGGRGIEELVREGGLPYPEVAEGLLERAKVAAVLADLGAVKRFVGLFGKLIEWKEWQERSKKGL